MSIGIIGRGSRFSMGKNEGALDGVKIPFKTYTSPSCKEDIPIMERGINPVRLCP